jgi:hypothetical protein
MARAGSGAEAQLDAQPVEQVVQLAARPASHALNSGVSRSSPPGTAAPAS